MLLRIAMLVGLVWLAGLNVTLFRVFGRGVTLKDLVLIGGGLFLLAKGTTEIHDTLELEDEAAEAGTASSGSAGFAAVMVQIGLINIVFSLDSVITAVGMTDNLPDHDRRGRGVDRRDAVRRQAGRRLHPPPADHQDARAFVHTPDRGGARRGWARFPSAQRPDIYFAIAFSLFVEALNIAYHRARDSKPPSEAPARTCCTAVRPIRLHVPSSSCPKNDQISKGSAPLRCARKVQNVTELYQREKPSSTDE